ncbi:hypothetical protein GCK32_010406, partial [Trichostrongylus colubriformis]
YFRISLQNRILKRLLGCHAYWLHFLL